MIWKTEKIPEEVEFLELLNRSTPRLFVTPTILALNILIFAIMVLSGVSLFNPKIEQLLIWGANFGPFTVNLGWWRLFSSTFLHIGLPHLLFNMWCLWSLGKFAERMFGNWVFLMLYILSGLGGSVASLWWHPMVVTAGASGAIFGVAGGLLMFWNLGKLRIPYKVIQRNFKSLLFFIGYNLFYGFTESGIDNAGHIGGLLIGILVGAFLHRPLPVTTPYPRLRYYLVLSGVALTLIIGAGFAKKQAMNSPLVKLVAAIVFLETGELDQAIVEFKKVIAIKPDFVRAHNHLGVAYLRRGLYGEAIATFNKVLELKPLDAAACYNRGISYSKQGQYDESIYDFSMAIEINPRYTDAYFNRGEAFVKKGQYDQGISDFTKAIEITPRYAKAYNYKAWILATCPDNIHRDGSKAVELAKKAVEFDPKANYLDTLAAAYAEEGKFEDAIITQGKVIDLLKKESMPTKLIDLCVERIKSYKAHEPWREK